MINPHDFSRRSYRLELDPVPRINKAANILAGAAIGALPFCLALWMGWI